MTSENEDRSKAPIIRQNMVTDDTDVNIGRMQNTELTREVADTELQTRNDLTTAGARHADEMASGVAHHLAVRLMAGQAARGISNDGPTRESKVIESTVAVTQQYDELQQIAAEVSRQRLIPPAPGSPSAN